MRWSTGKDGCCLCSSVGRCLAKRSGTALSTKLTHAYGVDYHAGSNTSGWRSGVQRSLEFHSYKTLAGPHGVWWLSPCRSTLRICFHCKAGAVLHPTPVMRVGNSSSWLGLDDKTARIDMTLYEIYGPCRARMVSNIAVFMLMLVCGLGFRANGG